MKYHRLGRTGLFVSELCLGTMTFGGGTGMWESIGTLGQDAADAMLKAAVDAGVNFVDTADVYHSGQSEEVTGQAIRNLGLARDEVVVATKAFGQMGEGPNGRGASRFRLIDACKASLKRLGLDHIDLYQIHGFDPATPMEETLRALHTLVEHGHVRYVGLSNWAAWQVAKATGMAERLGLHRPVSLQSYYSLAGRDLEREVVPMLQGEGVGLMVWSPLAGGYLTGKYSDGDAKGRREAFDFPPVETRGEAVVEAMRPVAEAHGCSMAQVALAWLLAQPAVTTCIVGATKMEQLTDNLGAVELTLTDGQLTALDEASALPREYPGWMLERQGDARRTLLAESKAVG